MGSARSAKPCRIFCPPSGGVNRGRYLCARGGESRLVAAFAFASAFALRLLDLPRLRLHTPALPRARARVYDRERVAGLGSQSDEALMAAYARGDRAAFEELFRRLSGPVHGFFLRSFRDAAVADDLLQVTFLKVHRARAEYQPALPLKPWLFTIAARVRLDALRKRYRLREDADEERLAAADEAQALARAQESAADDASGRAASVREALDQLPESQRTVVHLHRYEGMTFPEIARVLGSTEAAIKLRAFRAYERLRVVLAHLGPGRPGAGGAAGSPQAGGDDVT